jgi:hypothetical protein
MHIVIPASQRSSNGNGQHHGNGHGSSGAKRPVSAARVEANRRNARKSTGPRSAEGKRRASMNALKHGVCSSSPVLPGECGTTFNTFAEEVRADLRPRTAVEITLVQHITCALWRLQRMGDVERAVLRIERERLIGKTTTPAKMKLPPRLAALEDETAADVTDDDAEMWPCEVIARCFAGEDPQKSPLLLLQRYERSLHNTVTRLMARLDLLKKRDNRDLYDPSELEHRGERPRPAPPRPAPQQARNEPNAESVKPQPPDAKTGSAPQDDEIGLRNEANDPARARRNCISPLAEHRKRGPEPRLPTAPETPR